MSKSYKKTPTGGRRFYFSWSVFACSILLLIICSIGSLTEHQIFFANDIGVSFAVGSRIWHGEIPLLGPPSHLGGRSLGPFYYYFVALCLGLARNEPMLAFQIGAVAEIISVAIFFGLLSRALLGQRWWALGATLSLVLAAAGRMMSIFQTPWHANFLVIPASFLFCSSILCFVFGRRGIPLCLFAASIFGLSSLSCLPVAAVAVLYVFIFSPSSEDCAQPLMVERLVTRGAAQMTYLALFLLSLAPTAVYELFFPSNLLHIIEIHRELKGPNASLFDAAAFSARVLSAVALDSRFFPIVTLPFTDVVMAVWVLAATLLLALFMYKRGRVAMKVAGFCLATAIGTMFSLVGVSLPLYDYYLNPLMEVSIGLTGAALAVGILAVVNCFKKFPKLGIPQSKTMRVGLLCASIVLFAIAIPTVSNSFKELSNASATPFPPESLADVRELTKVVQQIAPTDSQYRLILAGVKPLRENAVYFLMGDRSKYSFMHYANALHELPSFRDRINPEQALFIECETQPPRSIDLPSKVAKFWTVSKEVVLPQCEFCNRCKAALLAPTEALRKTWRLRVGDEDASE